MKNLNYITNDLAVFEDTIMSTKIEEIIAAVTEAGTKAYLWLQDDAGDCILWPDEAASVDDDGSSAIERWQLTPEEVEELNASEVCIDEHN